MAVTAVHGGFLAELGSTAIGGITAMGIPMGTEVGTDRTGDDLYPTKTYILSQAPKPRFTTEDIGTALGACAYAGVSMATSNLKLYARKHESGSTRASSSHYRWTVQHGLLVPTTLKCEHRGNASLDYEGTATYDTENDPVVVNADAELAEAPTENRFTIGTISLADTALTQVQSLEFQFGLNVVDESGDSDIWATLASIQNGESKITIQTTLLSAASVGLAGSAMTHANTSITLRRRADGGTFAGSNDITITAAGVAILANPFEGGTDKKGQATIEITCAYDGTNLPLAITVG